MLELKGASVLDEDMFRVNSHGVNAKLSFEVKERDEMKRAGFVILDSKWTYMRYVAPETTLTVSFPVGLPTGDGELELTVIDESTGKPIDLNNGDERSDDVANLVRKHISALQDAGIISGYEPGERLIA